jgi:hypothetical protein
MAEMLSRLDIDPMRLVRTDEGRGYRELADVCLSCFESERCEAWLRNGERDEPMPPFCRARSLLERILKEVD